jgi:hypothetical protein
MKPCSFSDVTLEPKVVRLTLQVAEHEQKREKTGRKRRMKELGGDNK